jgi:uncharacterized phiE125 gp8 family phage protein
MTMQRIEAVLEPAVSLALVDLDVVKDELGIALDNTAQDARLRRFIAQASAQIQSYCRRVFAVQTYRNTFVRGFMSWPTTGSLVLSEQPVTEILGITDDDALLELSDYEADLKSGMLCRLAPGMLRCCWSARQTIVDFKAGYTQIPDDVQAAALRVITLQRSVQGRDPYLKVREGPTYGREEFWIGNMPLLTGGLPPDVAQLLDGYVKPAFA